MNLKLDDIVVCLLNNQTQQEFDTLFTRNKSFSQGMDLVNQLFSMAVKEVAGQEDNEKAGFSAKDDESVKKETKKIDNKKRKQLTLKLINPFPPTTDPSDCINSR